MKLYDELASWFHLLTAPEDYKEEAELYTRLIVEHASGPALTVLEMGSGGGNNASHMKSTFELTLTDRSEAMLEVSRALNPECEHLPGDMRTLRLGRTFDAVFVHDAVVYLTSETDLKAAMATAAAHCRPGGVVLFAPDCVRETYFDYANGGGHDGADGRSLRYHERVYDPDPSDTVYEAELTMTLREADGSERVVTDLHRCGLFSKPEWTRWLSAAGFRVEAQPCDLGGPGVPLSYVLVGVKPRQVVGGAR